MHRVNTNESVTIAKVEKIYNLNEAKRVFGLRS
jgi:hypothetical protein